MRHLLTTKEFNKEELLALIQLGREMKANPAAFRTSPDRGHRQGIAIHIGIIKQHTTH